MSELSITGHIEYWYDFDTTGEHGRGEAYNHRVMGKVVNARGRFVGNVLIKECQSREDAEAFVREIRSRNRCLTCGRLGFFEGKVAP